MKYVIQKNVIEKSKPSYGINNIAEFKFDDSDQVFVVDESSIKDAKGFFEFAGVTFKYVLPSSEDYTYPELLSETDAKYLISYDDFIKELKTEVVNEPIEDF